VLEVKLEHFPYERRTRVTKGDGGVWEYHYNQFKTLTKIVGPDGVTESFVTRPEDGQIAFEIDGAKNKIDYEYDAEGALIGYRDELGRPMAGEGGEHPAPCTPLEYELGHLVPATTSLPEPRYLQMHVPDIADLLVVATETKDGHLHEVRDVQGLLIREERDGLARRYGYDPNGNLRWETDFDGSMTRYEYSSFNHQVKKIDPNGFITDFQYTKEDTLRAVEDAERTWTRFLQDLRGNVRGVWRGGVWKEGYRLDGAGRLVEKTNSRGRKLYDVKRGPQGETVEVMFGTGGGYERFEYDEGLHIVRAQTASTECTFAYDNQGVCQEDKREGKGVWRSVIGETLIEYRVLEKFVTHYRYSETPYGSQDAHILDPTGRWHCIREHGYGVVTREYANGRKETTQYHPEGHVLVRHLYGGKTGPWTRRYEYSGEGYMKAKFDTQGGWTRYEQDAGHRLLSEQGPGGAEEAVLRA
jgi:YD repeat-containing protein